MAYFRKQNRLIIALVGCLSAISGGLIAQDDGDAVGRSGLEVESEEEQMFRVAYPVPPTFLDSMNAMGEPVADPFADPVEPAQRSQLPQSAVEFLEQAGITFPPGASATYFPRTSEVVVINTEDQLELADMFLCTWGPSPVQQINIFVESIEVEAALYHDWMFRNRLTQDGTKLRKQVQRWVKAGGATLISISAMKGRSGQRSKTQSVSQVRYPTDTDPGMISNEVHLEGAETVAPIAAVSPAAFDRRDVGTTVEADSVIGADGVTIDLNLATEIVNQKGTVDWPPKDGDPLFTVSVPEFHTMKIATQLIAQHRRYAFLGTTKPLNPAVETRKRPLVLTFARGDIAVLGEDSYQPFKRIPVERK